MKIIGTILLTDKNQYIIGEDNHLPDRPNFDKAWLTALAKNQVVSYKGYKMLPSSIKKEVNCDGRKIELPITIPEINDLCDILIVIRSLEINEIGKIFRFDNFTQIIKDRKIEIWIRN